MAVAAEERVQGEFAVRCKRVNKSVTVAAIECVYRVLFGRTHTHAHTHIHVHTHTHTYSLHTHTHTLAHMRAHKHTHTLTHTLTQRRSSSSGCALAPPTVRLHTLLLLSVDLHE